MQYVATPAEGMCSHRFVATSIIFQQQKVRISGVSLKWEPSFH
jgi:hypothetical protein